MTLNTALPNLLPAQGGSSSQAAGASGLSDASSSGLAGLFSLLSSAETQVGGLSGVNTAAIAAIPGVQSVDARSASFTLEGITADTDILSLLQGVEGEAGLEGIELTGLLEQLDATLTSLQENGLTEDGVTNLAIEIRQVTIVVQQQLGNAGFDFAGLDDFSGLQDQLFAAFDFLGFDQGASAQFSQTFNAAFELVEGNQDLLADGFSFQSLTLQTQNNEGVQNFLTAASLQVGADSLSPLNISTALTNVLNQAQAQRAVFSFETQQAQAPVTDVVERILLDAPLTQGSATLADALEVSAPVDSFAASFSGASGVNARGTGNPLDTAIAQSRNADPAARADSSAGVPTQTVQAVPAISTFSGSIGGQVVFQLTQTTDGNVLEQVADLSAIRQDVVQAQTATADLDAQLDTARLETPRSSFAERLAEYNRISDLNEQVQPAVQTLLQEGGGTVRIALSPVELGHIEIELDIRDGRVQGSIASANPEVVEQLARELHLLQQGLEDAGLDLGERGIAFLLQDQNNGSGGNGNGQNQDDTNEPEQLLAAHETDTAFSETGVDWINPSQLVDVRI